LGPRVGDSSIKVISPTYADLRKGIRAIPGNQRAAGFKLRQSATPTTPSETAMPTWVRP
jgi:hypothetical protein